MITALERHRTYVIGQGEDAKPMTYLGRHFPDDHPPVFDFQDQDTGEVLSFSLDQLTHLEKTNALRYGGVAPFNPET